VSCLSNIVTRDLAEDLLPDIYGMMNSSKPYIRKKATLVLLSIFHQYPKGLRLSFDRLKAKLTDDDPGERTARKLLRVPAPVDTAHRHARTDAHGPNSCGIRGRLRRLRARAEEPKGRKVSSELNLTRAVQNYLKLAPLLFQILKTSTNNWVLIKVVKLVRVA
jgi:AP-3 complex subunit delta-1